MDDGWLVYSLETRRLSSIRHPERLETVDLRSPWAPGSVSSQLVLVLVSFTPTDAAETQMHRPSQAQGVQEA